MKNYKITINGKTYDVGVEDGDVSAPIKSVQPAQPKAAAPAPAPKAEPAAKAAPAPKVAAGSGDVTAPMAGTVLSIAVAEGEQVKAGQVLLIFEAMKMEAEITAPAAGTVKKVHVAKGALLENGTVVVTLS
ncbi:MAG: biotin/lipoyl-binding protein [Oscillospiraceae bacterium]|jgi:glutaconyl-CoA decarboxylase|nr:biotin/lipoyl-binding protein [Oscillospiraceae bacterium]